MRIYLENSRRYSPAENEPSKVWELFGAFGKFAKFGPIWQTFAIICSWAASRAASVLFDAPVVIVQQLVLVGRTLRWTMTKYDYFFQGQSLCRRE